MCLVVAFSNSKKLDIRKTANAVGPLLLAEEPDGFGYAVLGDKGQFGEKYVGENFKSRINTMHRAIKLPFVKKQHELFGTVGAPMGPAIFHGRTSTNDSGLLNCHPMRREGWSLIHNGVVTDHGPGYIKHTTNDSEDVLKHLIDGIESVEKHLSGYYAFAAIDPNGRLHIARDKSAYLHCAWSDEIESYVFGTTYELVEDVSKALNLKVGPIDAVEDNVYMILTGNDVGHIQSIQPLGWGVRESRYAEASLGRKLDAMEYEVTSYGGAKVYKRSEVETSEFKLEDMVSEGWPSEAGRGEEAAYYELRRELDSMDDTYEILLNGTTPISPEEFYKLDHISQELCLIIRPDGSVVDMEVGYSKAE